MDLTTTDFTWVVDIVVILLVVVSAYLAMLRGVIRELFALLSWAVAFFAAFALAPLAQPFLNSLPVVGPFLADCQLSMLAAFVVVFGIALLATGLIIWVFSGNIRSTSLSLFDQSIGFIFGALRGLVLVAVVYIAYLQIVPTTDQYAFVENAMTIDVVRQAADIVRALVPDEVPGWLESRVNQLMGECDVDESGVAPEFLNALRA